MNIITSAFPFGYGPTSKMLVIAKQLRSSNAYAKIDFVGSDIALTFAKQNAKYYDDIIAFDRIKDIDVVKYDLAICVMNHYFVIWAFLHRVPTVFIDSLFWFWEWDDEKRLAFADDFIRDIRNGMSFDDAMALSEKFNSHELKYVAYRLADTVMTQDFVEERYSNKPHAIRDSITRMQIGPIVDMGYVRNKLDKTDVLISLAGTYSPLNREPQATAYANLVLSIIDDFINNLPTDTNIIMTVNPDLLDKITPTNKRINLVSLSHDEFLKQLNKSRLLLAPAGVTTIYESICYGTPIVFLPEQHDGHFENYMRLTSDGRHSDVFPNLLFNTRLDREASLDPDLEILNIQKLIKDKAKDTSYINELKEALDDLAGVIVDKTKLSALAVSQRNVLSESSAEAFNINDYITKEMKQ
jgi:hypothetical protein